MIAFEDRFGLESPDWRKILAAALSRGGDFADLFFEYRVFNLVNLEEDIVKETAEAVSLGLGIRVNAGEKTGFAYVNELAMSKILDAARTAAAVASGAGFAKVPRLRTVRPVRDVYTAARPLHGVGLEARIALAQEAYTACQRRSSRISKTKVLYQDSVQYVSIVNSEGLVAHDARPMAKLSCFSVAEKDGRRESGYAGGGGRVGLEYFRDVLTPEAIGREAAEEALRLLDAAEAPAGEMPVVLAPGHSGVLVHEAVGHLLEADFIRKKTSVFWDKRGQSVGSTLLTIYDDPTIPSFRGSYNIDDEGTPASKTLLIDRGVVSGYLQDRLSARLMGLPLTGHGRRQDYACIPVPRMANTYVDKGEHDPGEIISSVPRGIYAEKFEGGQVEDSGKFTFSISSGYLIEGGRLTAPIRQATLVGTNIDILRKIEMVGNDVAFSMQTGTCSKEGQDVPVADGCPTIKISRMTVGGQGE
jgi:TldD protein